ncbi:MAG: site-specific integrase [Acidobacteriota bacterium]|nr:site-specific integrase [Acidobacteriota bacterium]
MRMFLDFLGRDRRPETLSRRDWDRFIRERRAGRVGPSGKPVSDSTIAFDLRILLASLNWAAKSRDERGSLLIGFNPLKGLGGPRVKPYRIMLSDEEYEALLKVPRQVGWRFHVALVLAHDTGHRIGAIRKLRWSGIEFEDRTILWRGEHEKTGHEHRTPATDEAITAVEEARRHAREAGHALVPPAPRDPSTRVSRSRVSSWWKTAERRAGLEPKRGRGWHSLRRNFASDLIGLPLRCSAISAAGRKPGPSCGATSTPTRYDSGRLWTAAPEGWRLILICGNRTAGVGFQNPVSDAFATRSRIGSSLRAVGSPLTEDLGVPRGTDPVKASAATAHRVSGCGRTAACRACVR